MVVTLSGANSYVLQESLNGLVMPFLAQHGDLALERIDAEEADFARLSEALTSLPFLTSKKMVLLRAPSNNKTFVGMVEQLLLQIPDTTNVVIIEPKLDKRSAYYKFLKRVTDFRDFGELDQNGLIRWLSVQAKQRGGSLSSHDARYLVDRIGPHQLQLASELEKLLLYDAKISKTTIDLLTEAAPQSTIFQLLESAFAGNSRRVLQLYKEQRALKVEPPQIIAMVAWQLHIIAIIKVAGERNADHIAKEAKVNPYVVGKSMAIAQHISLSRLKLLIDDLLTIDSRSKRQAIDSDEALQLYLLKLAS
jgi:DNA polymerase-3 subunit delta